MASLVLFRRGHWTVNAKIDAEGRLSIDSGDLDNEWHTHIDRPHLPLMLRALKNRLVAAGASSDAGDDVLALLVANFHRVEGEANPYEEIRSLLTEAAIPHKHEFWGNM